MNKNILITSEYLENKIYSIRGQKVMFDFDLAEIYGYSTSNFNRQVKNNIEKFDSDFMFRLTREELDDLVKCKNCTSPNIGYFKGQNGGTRKLPNVFTEQGIYMLMTVLKGDLAIKQSKALIRLFKTMKDYIYDNNGYFPYKELDIRTTKLEKNVESIKCDLDKVMDNFVDENTYKHFLIINGRKIEADCAYMKIFKSAKRSIYYIDNYTNLKTLELLSNVNNNVEILLFTDISKTSIKEYMIKDFSIQNPSNAINVKDTSNKYHDRYIIVDYGLKSEAIYHCGASCKDGGNKISSIVKIDEFGLYKPMIKKLLKMPSINLK